MREKAILIHRNRRQKCALNVRQLSITTASMNHVVCLYLFYVYVCFVCINVFVPYACSSHQGQQRVVDLLGLKVQML